jgi:hypothetical protein
LQKFRGHAGAILSFVEGPLAETAADIAGRAYRQMYPPVVKVCLPGKTGMPVGQVFKAFPYLWNAGAG